MQNRTLEFSDGIQLISGENESGKSTVHTFIRSMLFGMTRGRGRAAKNDVYSRYEPWENPASVSYTHLDVYKRQLLYDVSEK